MPVEVFELVRAGPHETPLDVERARGLGPLAGREAELAAVADAPPPRRWAAAPVSGSSWSAMRDREVAARARWCAHVTAVCGSKAAAASRKRRAPLRCGSTCCGAGRRSSRPTDAVAAMRRALEGDPAPRTQGEIEERVRALLDGVAAGAPLSIHIEDAHWRIVASRQLIDALIAHPTWSRGIRILATARRRRVRRVGCSSAHGEPHPARSACHFPTREALAAQRARRRSRAAGELASLAATAVAAAIASSPSSWRAAFADGDVALARGVRGSSSSGLRRSPVREHMRPRCRDVGSRQRIDGLPDPLKSLHCRSGQP
jgi:hypothetical protein